MNAFLVEKPGQGIFTQLPTPIPGDNEVLVEVRAAGVCGTDIHIYNGEYSGTYPRIPGHEFSGVIAALGKNVTRFTVGQAVSADPNVFCEACDNCRKNNQNFCQDFSAVGVTRHGGFAQYVTVPQQVVFDITGIDFADAAMIEPLACVVYGQQKAPVPLGGHVLVLGAGPIGLLHAQLAAVNGAASVTVTDLSPEKLALAKALGADHVCTAAEFDAGDNRNAYELVIDCTGIPAVIENAVKYVKDAGTFLLFGVCPQGSRIAVDPFEIFDRELTLVGSFALKKTFGQALDLVRSKKIRLAPLVSGRLTLQEAPAFFAKVAAEGNKGMKTLIFPQTALD